MADEKEKSKEQAKDAKGDKTNKKSLVGILIMAGIVLGGAGGGFFLATLLSPAPQAASAADDPADPGKDPAGEAKPAGGHGAAAKPAASGHGAAPKPAAKPAAGGHGAPAPSGGGHGAPAKPAGPVLPIIETADGWFYELDAVMANLDEPGVTRFLRASITIQFTTDYDAAAGGPLVHEKKMILRDWLTTYFAGLTIEDVRGTMSLARIKNQIRDQFNEMLFPDSKPLVHAIILKEFAVQ